MPSPLVDLSGQTFGKLTAVFPVKRGKHKFWLCRCSCGRTIFVRHDCLRKDGHQESCGCSRRRVSDAVLSRHGMSGIPENLIWRSMNNRCYAKSDSNFPKYGARGIKVCDRWRRDFLAFLSDMGKRPSTEHSIERLDNDGDYDPTNCVWATRKEQQRNTRRNRIVVVRGCRMTLAGAVERFGGKYHTVKRRLYKGWTIERALNLEAAR